MPAVLSKISTSVFSSALSLPHSVWTSFKDHPHESNIVYAHALKAKSDIEGFTGSDQLWIVCTTDEEVDFVLSCTRHPMGEYPAFIYCAHPSSDNTRAFVKPRIQRMAEALYKSVDVQRIYSIFSLELVSRVFAEIWSRMTRIPHYTNPYYAARLTFCTKFTRIHRQPTIFPDLSFELRLATVADIPAAAELCYGFAAEAKPFVLTMEEAVNEATILIDQEQLWVHTIQAVGQPAEIASIVAVTRESPSVAAITKVYTNPNWRSNKCAERLVRKVTQSLLESKEGVILYVAHDNVPASKVYHRVGFVGLSKSSPPVDGVDSWVELGFERCKITLGHW